MNLPDYSWDKIKFATDRATLEKAIDLYEGGKVTQAKDGIRSYSAVVLGTKPYQVFVEARRYDYGHCTCYLGENGTLCKHMVAVAIWAVKRGKKLTNEEKKIVEKPACSGTFGVLGEGELGKIKTAITTDLRYIKGYRGPSKTWFAYQNSLEEGCNRLIALISDLPVNPQIAELLTDLLLRLDRKLCVGGVDDSDGTVGGFMQEVVEILREYVRLDPKCNMAFGKLRNRETCFGWEEPLINLA